MKTISTIWLLTLVASVVGVANFFTAENALSSEDVDVYVTGRSRRDVASGGMAKHYDVILSVGNNPDIRARLRLQDVVGDLDTYDERGRPLSAANKNGYKREWAAYASDDIDGVFIVHRHPCNQSNLSIEGHMMHDNTPFLLQPNRKTCGHVRHKLGERTKHFQSDSFVRGRPARAAKKPMMAKIEVHFDPYSQNRIRKHLGDNPSVDSFINEFYVQLVASVNKITKDGLGIEIRGSKLVIQQNEIPKIKRMVHSVRPHLDGTTTCAINTLKFFKEHTIPLRAIDGPDHFVLITGYLLLDEKSKVLSGRAYHGTICTVSSQSVITMKFTRSIARTVAHELTHSFGAEHDIIPPGSSNTDYIMSPYNLEKYHGSRYYGYLSYSKESQKQVANHLKVLTASKRNCLDKKPPYQRLKVPRLGSRMTLQQQCRLMAGPGAKFVPGKDQDRCKSGLKCQVGGHGGFKYFAPYEQTPCGESKICIKGKCEQKRRGKRHPE